MSLFIAFLLALQISLSQEITERSQLTRSIEREIFFYRFDDAVTILNQHKQLVNSYRYSLYKAVIYFFRYFADQPDSRNKSYMDSLIVPLQKTLRDEDKIKAGNNSDDMLMLGGAYGFIGMAEYVKKNRYTALKMADDAREILEELLEKDSAAYDAYFGIGIYNHALSQPPAILRFILSILGYSGDYETGIKQLKIVADKGKETKVQSILYLINHALFEDDHYKNIDPVFNDFPDDLKQSPMYCYKRLLFNYGLEKYEQVEPVFHELEKYKSPDYIYWRSKLYVAMALTKLKELNRAQLVLNEIQKSTYRFTGGMFYDFREAIADLH
ncbi:MAG: hypothetical protein KDD94_05175, partial [Calditrichaeota bacterium]|nr:hypothetical protein [Calditrichota bacterium]